jgi:ferrous iron transport protein A
MFTLLLKGKAMKADPPRTGHPRKQDAAAAGETSAAISLDRLPGGGRGIVRSIGGTTTPLRQRLMELGITIGSQVEVIRKAPFGGPIEISVRGYRLSLRRSEALLVLVDRQP